MVHIPQSLAPSAPKKHNNKEQFLLEITNMVPSATPPTIFSINNHNFCGSRNTKKLNRSKTTYYHKTNDSFSLCSIASKLSSIFQKVNSTENLVCFRELTVKSTGFSFDYAPTTNPWALQTILYIRHLWGWIQNILCLFLYQICLLSISMHNSF